MNVLVGFITGIVAALWGRFRSRRQVCRRWQGTGLARACPAVCGLPAIRRLASVRVVVDGVEVISIRARRPAVRFIFVTLILIVLGFGIIIPVLPGLVIEFEGGSAAAGAHSFGWLVGSFALMQFIASPILGALSDRFGRRRVILIALAGSAIDYVVMGFAPSLGWLFVARIIAGLTAGAPVSTTVKLSR